MNKVYGIKEVAGNYQGHEFHNVNIHTLVPSPDGVGHGELCEVIKVRFTEVTSVFGKQMTPDDWLDLIGKYISVSYNRYGNVSSIAVVPNVDFD